MYWSPFITPTNRCWCHQHFLTNVAVTNDYSKWMYERVIFNLRGLDLAVEICFNVLVNVWPGHSVLRSTSLSSRTKVLANYKCRDYSSCNYYYCNISVQYSESLFKMLIRIFFNESCNDAFVSGETHGWISLTIESKKLNASLPKFSDVISISLMSLDS